MPEIKKETGPVVHFPGLNGIRAIAAILVVTSHISLSMGMFGRQAGKGIDMAGYGVTMFFVLSGFLITYLLLAEQSKYGTISFRDFYIRRVLRIWPLYYLILAAGIGYQLITGGPLQANSVLCYVFLLPNIPFCFGGMIGIVAPLWSVGVEEQFYLFWPSLFRAGKKLPWVMAAIVVIYLSLKLYFRIIENGPIYTFITATRFHCMAIGGLGAYAYFKKWTGLKWVYNPVLQALCWGLFFISIYKPIHIYSFIDEEIYAAMFWVLILNTATNPKRLLNLEQKPLDWLGKISYGIYLYHEFAIAFIGPWLKGKISDNWTGTIIIYASVYAATVVLAQLSYNWYEKYFLTLKEKFKVVRNRP